MGAVLEAEMEYLDDRMLELLNLNFHTESTAAQRRGWNSRRAQDRPLCPKCGQDEVRCNSSGQRKVSRYLRCYGCGHHWSERVKEQE